MMIHSNNTMAVAPGATIREQLDIRGMSQKEFALRMDMSEKHISHLINGKVELSHGVALRLESVLGLPASFWNNLEALYREQLSRVEAELDMENDEIIASIIPYAKIASFGWVPPTRKIKEKVSNLRSFFEVAKLGLLEDLCIPGIAYRTNGASTTSNYALAVWAQKARIEARKSSVKPINIAQLREDVPKIRNLTVLDPSEFCDQLSELLDNSGVAIVYLPHINGSFLHGASFIDGNQVVLGLTVRGRDADRFWFSLFHELYHIINGHIHCTHPTTPEQEKEADCFARDTLIPMEQYNNFVQRNSFSRDDIIQYANKINIASGILLGRLQKENRVPYDWYHDLKIQYQIH
ncbi:MAG: helix-turn-helix domain-containing protein [Saccharofermentanales bacterium]